MKRILLVDGSNLFHRAHHTSVRPGEPIRNCGGFPTNIVAKSARMLARLVDDTQPDRVIFGLDGGSDYRRGFYPDYKAQRKPKAEAIVAQLPLMHEIIQGSGVEYVFEPGQECDDLLMTLASMAKGRSGIEVLMATQDKDYAQLVGDNVIWLCPSSEGWERCDAETVRADFGVPPSQIHHYLSMVGDVADNTPGIEGIGPKKAVELLAGEPDDDTLIDLVAAKKGWARERASSEMALNYRLIRPNLIAGLKVASGSSLDVVMERLEQLNCLEAASIWRRLAVDFGRRQRPEAPRLPSTAPFAQPAVAPAKQAELSLA